MKRLRNSLWPVFACAALATSLVCAGGCTVLNARLNGADVPLEQRRHNQTPAETGVAITPPEELDGSSALIRAPATASTAPAENAQHSPWHEPHTPDGYFVGLAVSGGGSRSANFGAACMFQLQRVGILQHVDYISSVSGGSLVGTYYCVARDDQWNPGNVQRVMTHPFANDMLVTLLQPWNSLAIAVTSWNRSDLLADSLNRVLYTRDGRVLTFSDLRRDRPHLLINATDLQTGRRFVFCNESFDALNSDLSRYSISYAVTASSAVPVLLHYVTLRDYSTIYRAYVHLIDGGINDNLGVQTLLEVYAAQCKAAADRGLPPPYPNGAIFIVIDAKTRFNADLSHHQDLGFFQAIKAGLGLSSTALLSRASSATLAQMIVQYAPDAMNAAQLRANIERLDTTGFLDSRDRFGNRVRVVHLSLDLVNGLQDLPFARFSESLDDIATYFNIHQSDAYKLYVAADLLMRERFEPILRPIAAELNSAEAAGRGSRH